MGILNTDWGDYGHINDPRLTVPGMLYGAAFAWNADEVPFDEINEAVSRLEYGDASGTLAGAMAEMSDHEVFDWWNAVNWIESSDERRAKLLAKLDMTQVPAANAAVEAARGKVLAAARSLPAGRKDIVAAGLRGGRQHPAVERRRRLPGRRATPPATRPAPRWPAAWSTGSNRYRIEWDKTSRVSATPNLIRLMNAWADCLRGRAYGSVPAPEAKD